MIFLHGNNPDKFQFVGAFCRLPSDRSHCYSVNECFGDAIVGGAIPEMRDYAPGKAAK
jgi:hypothetical protein